MQIFRFSQSARQIVGAGLLWGIALSLVLTGRVSAATVGTVAPILGQPRSLAYDATRKLLFIANTTENRIEVYSTDQNQFLAPIPVGRRPVGIDLVPGGSLLLVCNSGDPFLTLINLSTMSTAGTILVTARSTLVAETPFSVVAFAENAALLSTNAGIQRVDLAARTTLPITTAGFAFASNTTLVPSGDRRLILGQGGGMAFLYNTQSPNTPFLAEVRASGSAAP